MPLMFFLFATTALAITWTLARRASRNVAEEDSWGLSWVEGVTRFFLLWIGIDWILAAFHQLSSAGLMVSAVLMSLVAAGIVLRNPTSYGTALLQARETLRNLGPSKYFMGIIGLLMAFNLFKGWVLPCANTDALSWSMPIAIRYHLNQGLDWINPPQIEWLSQLSHPHNYELMVASILSLTGTDRVTEWLSTLSACGILVVIGVLFRRWSGSGLHVWTVVLVFAAAPVFLLHLAADKADLLTTLLIILAIFWTVRAWLEEGTHSGVLALWVAFALFNVKRSGWMMGPPLMLAVYIRWGLQAARAHTRWTPVILRAVGHSLAAALAMGGMKALWLWHHKLPILPGVNLVAHHSWADPLRFLWVVALAPFRSTDYTVRLLSGREWYWPEYNLIYSHYGWVFGPAVLAAIGVVGAGMLGRGPARRFSKEQWLFLGASTALAYLVLSRNYAYDGGFNTFPRFVLFLLPPIFAAGLLPLLASVRHSLIPGIAAVLMLGGSAMNAYDHDMVAPNVYLADLWKHPEKRRWILVGPNRMPCIVDRLAAPKAVVVSDYTYLTWLAPLWGEGFTRDVRLIEWKDERPQFPPEAEWVVIDNVSGLAWGKGHVVQNAEDFAKAFRHGIPQERDTRLFPILKADPAWEVVAASPQGEQAIFRRRSSSPEPTLP